MCTGSGDVDIKHAKRTKIDTVTRAPKGRTSGKAEPSRTPQGSKIYITTVDKFTNCNF